jgi:hypothetical protein
MVGSKDRKALDIKSSRLGGSAIKLPDASAVCIREGSPIEWDPQDPYVNANEDEPVPTV